MSFKIGQRVRVTSYPAAEMQDVVGEVGTVVNPTGSAYIEVALDTKDPIVAEYFTLCDGSPMGLFTADELEDASCCGNATGEFCPECPLTGSESIMARESTAPNADRITRLETQAAVLEDKVQELTDALADQQALIQTMAASIGSLWLDVCGG